MNQKPQSELELNKQELEQIAAGSENPEYDDIKALETTHEIEATVSNARRPRGSIRA